MSFTSLQLGSNCTQLTFTNTTVTEIFSAISGLLTSAGYVVHDPISTTRAVFKTNYYDSTVAKYIEVNVSSATSILISAWEAWVAMTHTGTNMACANLQASSYATITTAATMVLYVWANPQFVYLLTNMASNPTGGGVFEFMRDTGEDASLTPAFVTTHAALCGMTALQYVGGVPRARNGVLGSSATSWSALTSVLGVLGGTPTTLAQPGNMTAVGFFPVVTPVYWSKFDYSNTASEYRGRVFGLKMIPRNYGVIGDISSVNCDSDGFTDPTGTAADHFIVYGYALPV